MVYGFWISPERAEEYKEQCIHHAPEVGMWQGPIWANLSAGTLIYTTEGYFLTCGNLITMPSSRRRHFSAEILRFLSDLKGKPVKIVGDRDVCFKLP